MWVWLALGSALSLSLSDVAAKKAMRTHIDPFAAAWLKFFGAGVAAAPIWLHAGWPATPPAFWLWLACAVPLEALAIWLYHKAIDTSPLSLVVPMLAFTPVFLLGVGWVVAGERPGAKGVLGVFLVASGAYLLNLRSGEGAGEPLRALWREPGTRLMLAVAFLYSITASLGKRMLSVTSPAFFGPFYAGVMGLALTPALASPRRRAAVARVPLRLGLVIAGCYAAMVLFHFAALARAPVAYMIAVKRTSLLFAVLWGSVFFDEAAGWRRAAAAAVMLAGVVVLAA